MLINYSEPRVFKQNLAVSINLSFKKRITKKPVMKPHFNILSYIVVLTAFAMISSPIAKAQSAVADKNKQDAIAQNNAKESKSVGDDCTGSDVVCVR